MKVILKRKGTVVSMECSGKIYKHIFDWRYGVEVWSDESYVTNLYRRVNTVVSFGTSIPYYLYQYKTIEEAIEAMNITSLAAYEIIKREKQRNV